ncbi:MAG TPA: hypothetical protein VH879_00230 [Gemmatimonadales bacterium]
MMLWLVVFLVVAVAIQARQASAVMTARRLARLQEQRVALEAERAALQRQIRLGTSRKVLGDRAESELGLHFPQNSELRLLKLRSRRR